MRTPSPSWCGLDRTHLWPTGSSLGDPIDYGPELLLMPFGFHLAMDTLPSGDRKWWLQVRLGCIRLSSSCPFRRLHTFHFSGQRGFQPRFWIQCSSSEHRRDFNPPDQRAPERSSSFAKAKLLRSRRIPTLINRPGLARNFCDAADPVWPLPPPCSRIIRLPLVISFYRGSLHCPKPRTT